MNGGEAVNQRPRPVEFLGLRRAMCWSCGLHVCASVSRSESLPILFCLTATLHTPHAGKTLVSWNANPAGILSAPACIRLSLPTAPANCKSSSELTASNKKKTKATLFMRRFLDSVTKFGTFVLQSLGGIEYLSQNNPSIQVKPSPCELSSLRYQPQAPTLFKVGGDIVAGLVVYDALFFAVHYTCHKSRWLFHNVHSLHHDYKGMVNRG